MMRAFRAWRRDERAVVAIEVGLLLPLMVLMLLGTMDAGARIVVNEKVINSAQTVADLLARQVAVNADILDDTVDAGKLSLTPYPDSAWGVDIAGIQFNGGPLKPKEMWRETRGMSPNPDIVTGASGLGADKEGVLGITVRYAYTPTFSGLFTGEMVMQEVSYVRGRNGLYIPKV